jgi:hypothetical protein
MIRLASGADGFDALIARAGAYSLDGVLGIVWQEVRRAGSFTQLPRRIVFSETVRIFERSIGACMCYQAGLRSEA